MSHSGADASVLNENGDTLLHLLCSDIGFEGFKNIIGGVVYDGFVNPNWFVNQEFDTKVSNFFKQHNMLNAKNSAGDTPIFCALNYNGGRDGGF